MREPFGSRPGVASFGARQPEPEPDTPAVLIQIPPIVLDSVQLPVVLVVDADALQAAGEQIGRFIRAAVADAVAEGFADATGLRIEAGDGPSDGAGSGDLP